MKGGKRGPKLLSIALCALIALLAIKLGLTVMGALRTAPGVGVAVPVAMAKEERPQINPPVKHVSEPPVAVSATSGFTDSASMSTIEQQTKQFQAQQEQLREEREQLLALKKDVQEKINTLLALQKKVISAQSQKQNAVNSKVQGLARIYGTMKPRQAAKLMGSLSDGLVKSIISTMPPNKAASILALMDVKKAAKISEDLSGQ